MKEQMVLVGKILKTHGIKGLLKLQSYMHDPKDIFNYPTLYNKDLTKEYHIKFKNPKNQNTFIVSINDTTDLEEAEKFRSLELYIKRSELPKTKSDEFYYTDLIGLNVLTDNKKKGKILKVADFGAGSMLEIKWENGEEETIPFNDNFIKEINLKEKYIKIILPEYIDNK